VPCISTIGSGSPVEPCTQYLDLFSIFVKLTPGFSLLQASAISTALTPLSPFACGRQLYSLKLIRTTSSGGQSFSSEMASKREREISMVSDPPFINLVQGSYRNEHDAFEGHGKRNVTSKVLDPPVTNLIQKSDSDEEPMLIG